jgi:hypothetical protein
MVSLSDLRLSLSAICLKKENSCVAFDMLMETSTILPLSDGLPSASSGLICASASAADFFNASGGSLLPLPYKPPSSPSYLSSAVMSVSGLIDSGALR